jgi:hypothetical protein
MPEPISSKTSRKSNSFGRSQVPADLPSASVERLGDGDIVWELSFRLKVKGPDLVATFDIPVFSV